MYQESMMNNFIVSQSTTQNNISFQQTNEYEFLHYISDDNSLYHVTCQIITRGPVLDDHDYDRGFFYYDSTINYYYIKCKLFSLYGMNNDMINFERKKSLSMDQKLILERDLKQFLPYYFMRNHFPRIEMDSNINMDPLHRRYTEQMTSINDNQNYQNGAATYNVTQQQKQIDFNNTLSRREMRPNFRNIGNTVMAAPMNGNLNDIRPQQRVDFNNLSLTEREMRPIYNRNTNSSHECIEDNLMTTQATSMINNQKNSLSHQNRIEDTQQADFNNFPQCQAPANSFQNDVYDLTNINFDRDTHNAFPQQNILSESINKNYDYNKMSYNDNQLTLPTNIVSS
ncbi:hypothetical protein RclHR1_11450006 [Rhizophagus clarus]|nr:hypothetical protein RclHR1_11450006 [Rhizophagus clarus]